MRRFFSALLAVLFVYIIFQFIQVLPDYGKVDLSKRVSERFVLKNVSEENGKVVFGKSRNLEDGSANIVTSVVVNYRSFDTLGEVTVLFVSALGVGLYLGGFKKLSCKIRVNNILHIGGGIVFPLIMLFGAYIFTHGHLTPGGGFPGGTVIAVSVLLLYISDEKFTVSREKSKLLEGTMGSLYVIVGILGLMIGGFFLFNFMPTGTVGKFFSSGVIPIVYSIIGLKVGSELSGIVTDLFMEEGWK